MDKEIVFLVEESAEGGLEAHSLGISIFTEGETLDEIKENMCDAIHCHFEDGCQPTVALSLGGSLSGGG